MTEGKNNSENDDLSEFADYLAEFNSLLNFDDETCPVCGVNISDSLSIEKSTFVLYKCLDDEVKIFAVTKELELKCIPFKVEKRLCTEVNDKIVYLYDVLIPLKCLPNLVYTE
jgi:hypothetical protein